MKYSVLLSSLVVLSSSLGVYATSLPWGLVENQPNGFIAPKSGNKEVLTPEGCRKISGAGVSKDYFIPTKTTTEWNAFKINKPTGISIGLCSINASCGGIANTCSTGTPSGYDAGSCSGSQTWICNGVNGGSNASCVIPNPPCPVTPPPPSYTYSWNTSAFGSCSVSCGLGTQTRSVTCRRSDNMTVADSYCTGAKPTASQSCNMGVCPISCTLPWGGTIPNGASVTAYAYNEGYIYVQQCSYGSVKRTCINGTLNNPTHWWLGSPMIYGSCSTIGECPVGQVPLWCADSGGICGCTYL